MERESSMVREEGVRALHMTGKRVGYISQVTRLCNSPKTAVRLTVVEPPASLSPPIELRCGESSPRPPPDKGQADMAKRTRPAPSPKASARPAAVRRLHKG